MYVLPGLRWQIVLNPILVSICVRTFEGSYQTQPNKTETLTSDWFLIKKKVCIDVNKIRGCSITLLLYCRGSLIPLYINMLFDTMVKTMCTDHSITPPPLHHHHHHHSPGVILYLSGP